MWLSDRALLPDAGKRTMLSPPVDPLPTLLLVDNKRPRREDEVLEKNFFNRSMLRHERSSNRGRGGGRVWYPGISLRMKGWAHQLHIRAQPEFKLDMVM